MLTVDLHFHANVSGLSRSARDRRLNKYAAFFAHCGLNYQASTEHSYKKPVDTYLALAEAASHMDTGIIPGVESVSSEGVDIIFLFRDEDDFRKGFPRLHSFAWSVRHVAEISADIGAITSVPHPFFISRTAGGAILGRQRYRSLLRDVDYVEIHNGSALNASRVLAAPGVNRLFPKTVKKVDWTLDLPMALRGSGLGWSVGSDAHCPGEHYVAGCTHEDLDRDEHVFDFLKRRIRFEPCTLAPPSSNVLVNNMCVMRSLGSAYNEYMHKKVLKLRGRLAGRTANS